MIGRHIGITDDIDYRGWVYITVDWNESISSIIRWCRDNIDSRDWAVRAGATFYFKRESDATTFRLTWV